jgi:hypothetical protein
VQNLSPARIVAHGGFIPACLPILNLPRVNNVNFAVSVGTVVPTSVRVVDVVPALVEINPNLSSKATLG